MLHDKAAEVVEVLSVGLNQLGRHGWSFDNSSFTRRINPFALQAMPQPSEWACLKQLPRNAAATAKALAAFSKPALSG
jgi:hypothetical protein